MITSAAAPLSSSVKQFFKCAFSCKVISIYFPVVAYKTFEKINRI